MRIDLFSWDLPSEELPLPDFCGHPDLQVMDQVKKDMEADDKLRKDWEQVWGLTEFRCPFSSFDAVWLASSLSSLLFLFATTLMVRFKNHRTGCEKPVLASQRSIQRVPRIRLSVAIMIWSCLSRQQILRSWSSLVNA